MVEGQMLIDRMHALIENWKHAGDSRAIFLSCYQMMTHNMLVALENVEFEDRAWVASLLHHFAD